MCILVFELADEDRPLLNTIEARSDGVSSLASTGGIVERRSKSPRGGIPRPMVPGLLIVSSTSSSLSLEYSSDVLVSCRIITRSYSGSSANADDGS